VVLGRLVVPSPKGGVPSERDVHRSGLIERVTAACADMDRLYR